MRPLRTVGARLTLALLLVVAGALAIVYLVVVPRLEDRLVDAKLSQLADDAENRVLPEVEEFSPYSGWQFAVESAESVTTARIAVYMVARTAGPQASLIADSEVRFSELRNDPVAARAARRGARARGVVTRRGQKFGEVALFVQPLVTRGSIGVGAPYVLLVSAPLEDTLETVHLVERRLLLAGLFALAVALAVGYAGSRIFARRIRRLERAAERIASGRFDEAVVDTGADEIGQLARAFDDMRQRLATLERARREFVANASHELRTPLFALGGLLELLVDEDLDDETRREFLVTAREQVGRLTKLATDLLDLSRLDAGRLHVDREQVHLDEIARDLAEEFRGVAQSKEHSLEVVGEGATAIADEQRVFQIGRILIENALIHTAPGTAVRVSTRVDNGQAVLTVEDEGDGIPAEHAGHVFERFYRVDGAMTSGSGLGLAIARELAEVMGGHIDLASRPGRTVFTLRLPAARLPAAKELVPLA
ncbi:MAG: ATP-binding protein [Actinomycetota bacterium]|nr:ATP-binding protein [Actinomycetota bacterium]